MIVNEHFSPTTVSIKCGHEHSFGSPSADLGPRLHCLLERPFAAAGHGTPSRRLHGGSWRAHWPDLFWLGRWLLSLQPPPIPLSEPLSESSGSHVRSCRATGDRVGPNAAGRPRRGGPPPSCPSRIQVELVAPPRQARRLGRSARPARASRSEHHRRAGEWDQNNKRNGAP